MVRLRVVVTPYDESNTWRRANGRPLSTIMITVKGSTLGRALMAAQFELDHMLSGDDYEILTYDAQHVRQTDLVVA